MHKFISKIFILYIFISGCGFIIITTTERENVEDFRVDSNIKPSSLISKFVEDSTNNTSENYFLTFYDIYCGFSYQQITYCNKLYDLTNNDYEFIACTIYDRIDENEYRKKRKYENDFRYKYNTYYEINGLKASLRNLYYKNDIKLNDISPMNIIIANDSIVKMSRGAINTNLKFEYFKSFLDSIIRVQN